MSRNIDLISVKPSSTIRDAMVAMSQAFDAGVAPGIALVVSNKSLEGVVCDGDVRRGLVSGASLEDPVSKVMQGSPVTVLDKLTDIEKINAVLSEVKKKNRRDFKVDRVVVVNERNEVVDVLNFFDLWYHSDIKNRKICVLGMGYVGLTLALVLADADFKIVGYDVNQKMIDDLKEGVPHFYEKGLESLLKYQKGKNLNFTASPEDIVSDIYVITVGTPVDEDTKQPQMNQIESACQVIGKVLKRGDVVMLRSTVPLGLSRNLVMPILDKISGLKCGVDYHLVFAPERTLEGKALEELRELPQIIGGMTKECADVAGRIFRHITPTIILMDTLEEAELVKLINNTFRDVSFAFSNQVGLVCEGWNLDTVKIIRAANEGYKRNRVPLPSPGVGGPCLKKDPYILMQAGAGKVDMSLIEASRKTNEEMPKHVARKVLRFLDQHYKNQKEVKVFLMGLAFKGVPETSDIRNSTTLDLVDEFRKAQKEYKIRLCGYDAVVPRDVIAKYGIEYEPIKQGFADAHVVMLMNNHPEFAEMDVFAYLEQMKKPGMFFDGWYTFPPKEFSRISGIQYDGIGGFLPEDQHRRM